jgi:membrane-associated phospholipid phosphatase
MFLPMRLAGVCTLLLVAVLALIFTPGGRALDRGMSQKAVALDQAHPPLHAFMHLGTSIGLAPPILAALAAYGSFGDELARGTVRIGLITLAGGQGAVEILKRVFHRERPDHDANPDNASFPSSHSSAAAGLAWVVSGRHRRLAPWAWLVALWIASSRVFLGRHFPSDVLGGALVGIVFAAIAIQLEERLARAFRVR